MNAKNRTTPKSKQPPNSTRRRRNRKRSRRQRIPRELSQVQTAPGFGVFLSGCARDYARCMADPTPSGPLACVPSPYPNFSFKQRTYAKFTFSLGNNFEGFVVFSPPLAIVKGTPCAIANSPTFNLNVITLNDPNNVVATSNSNFNESAIGQGVNDIGVRVVGALMRIRYIGTELNRSGTATCIQDPTHASIQGRNQSELDSEIESRSVYIGKDWINIPYCPKTVNEYQFLTNNIPNTSKYPNIAAAVPYWYIGAWLSCSTQSKFEVECWCVGEVTGAPVTGQTLSHADPTALSAVVTAGSALVPHTASLPAMQENMLERASRYIATSTSYVTSAKKLGASALKFGEAFFGDSAPAMLEAFAAI